MKELIPLESREKIFSNLLKFSIYAVYILLAGILVTLFINSLPSIKEFGLGFITNKVWDPVFNKFGSLPFLVGTLLTSTIALIISFPFAISIAIFLGEYFNYGIVSEIFKSLLELLAGIPSVIYGLWSLFFLVPIIRGLETELGIPPYGVGILTASLVLSIMIIPYAASISREVINLVPSRLKEAAYALGATRYEVIKTIVLPYSKSGIFAGMFLAFGRALGETMAVTMVIGNSNNLPTSIFSPANTMASVIANEFTEATSVIYLSALVEIGLLLFLVTSVINIAGKQIIYRLSAK